MQERFRIVRELKTGDAMFEANSYSERSSSTFTREEIIFIMGAVMKQFYEPTKYVKNPSDIHAKIVSVLI